MLTNPRSSRWLGPSGAGTTETWRDAGGGSGRASSIHPRALSLPTPSAFIPEIILSNINEVLPSARHCAHAFSDAHTFEMEEGWV